MVVVVVVAAVVMVVVVRLLVLMLLMASSTLGSTEFLSCVRKGLVWLGSFLWSTKVDVFFFCFFLSSALSFTLFLSLFRVMWLVPNPHSKETLHSFVKRKLNSVRFHPQVSSTLSFIYFWCFGVSYPSNKSLQICYTNTNGDVLNVRVLGNCRPHSHWVF